MIEFFTALTEYSFLQFALLAGILASIGCGIMGTYVVLKRITFIAGGISHSVLGGMGVSVYYGFEPLSGALIAAIASALLIGWVRIKWRIKEDILIGLLWALGMAIGILFISQTPDYQADLMSYLFGSILLISKQSLWFMVILDIVLLLVIGIWHRQFFAVVFDEEFARLRGIPVTFFYLLLLVMIAVTVVLLIQVVGLILVLALLTLPASVAGHYVRSIGKMMLVATILGSIITVFGLGFSYSYNTPTGAIIVIIAAVVYIISAIYSGIIAKRL